MANPEINSDPDLGGRLITMLNEIEASEDSAAHSGELIKDYQQLMKEVKELMAKSGESLMVLEGRKEHLTDLNMLEARWSSLQYKLEHPGHGAPEPLD